MNSKRAYYLMVATVVLLVAAIFAGTYLANQQLQKQSAKLLEYKTRDQVLSREQTGLIKAKKDIEKYRELEQIAKAVVPQDKDQAQTVREIVKIAAEAGIKPTAITFPVSSLGMASAKPAAPSAGGSAAGSKGISQLTPVKGINGVYNLQITIQQDTTAPVPYARFLDFLNRLESNRRTAHVSGIVLQPTPANRDLVSFTLTVEEFIKPGNESKTP